MYIYIHASQASQGLYKPHKPHKACTSLATSLTRLVQAWLVKLVQASQALWQGSQARLASHVTSLTSLACEACHKACEGSYFLFVLYMGSFWIFKKLFFFIKFILKIWVLFLFIILNKSTCFCFNFCLFFKDSILKSESLKNLRVGLKSESI